MKRRKFIHNVSCAAMGTSTLYSSLLNMKAVGAAAMSNSAVLNTNDYKALVCVLLGGGNDSFNMLMPREGSAHRDYAHARSNNTIDSSDMLALDISNYNGSALGLHPSLPNLANFFHNKRLSFIANIGTLVEHITTDQYFQGTKQYPLGLFSHSDQIQQWQTAMPQDRSSLGWVGKMGELIGDMNNNQSLSSSVSMSGSNFIQTGTHTVPYVMIPGEGAAGIHEWDITDWDERILRNQAIKNMVDKQYDDAFQQTYINTIKRSLESFEQYKEAFDKTKNVLNGLVFPTDKWSFGQSLKTIADTIAARDILDQQRQTFFVEFGDWDHHDELLKNHSKQLTAVDQGIKCFYDAMDHLGMSDQVLTFVISDFARPLTSNGNGTDHAWGGNVFVIGGSNTVNGKRVFGRYPQLGFNDKNDVGGGVFIPEISADEYFAELALWFGASPRDLPTILPNIRNFYDINSGQTPIGFLNF